MIWTVENIINELRLAVNTQREMEESYDTDLSNHVSNVVDCILADFAKIEVVE